MRRKERRKEEKMVQSFIPFLHPALDYTFDGDYILVGLHLLSRAHSHGPPGTFCPGLQSHLGTPY